MSIADRELKNYYRALKRRLPYVKGKKKEFLGNVQRSVKEFLIEEPDATMQELYGQIGTADELCEEYKDALEPEEYARAVRRNRKLGIAAGIAAAACIAGCVWCGYLVYELRREPPVVVHEYITDSTEMGERGEAMQKRLSAIAEQKAQTEFGADMPRIGYADADDLVLYDDAGVYHFRLGSEQLTDVITFADEGLRGLQGDHAVTVEVAQDGCFVHVYDDRGTEIWYDLTAHQFTESRKMTVWKAQETTDTVENADCYSINGVQISENAQGFLALKKDVVPNYGALLYLYRDNGQETECRLFSL